MKDSTSKIDFSNYSGVKLGGDFNIDWAGEMNNNLLQLSTIYYDCGFEKLIDGITRPSALNPCQGSVIDLLFTTAPELSNTSVIDNPVGSDHHAVSVHLKRFKLPKKPTISRSVILSI